MAMAQSYADLKENVKRINELFIKKGINSVPVQKIQSTPHYVVLSVRFPGLTTYVYLGRGAGHEGLILFDQKPDESLRIKDKFLELLRAHLRGGMLTSIECDSGDRIIFLNFILKKEIRKIGLFWNGRKLYFCLLKKDKQGQYHVLRSWTNQYENCDQDLSFSIFDELGRGKFAGNLKDDKKGINLEEYFSATLEKLQKNASSNKENKKITKKIERIKEDLNRVEQAELAENELIDYPIEKFDEEKMIIRGIRIKFPPHLKGYQRRDYAFNKLKRLKKAKQLLEQRLSDTENQKITKIQTNIENIKVIIPVWELGESSQNFQKDTNEQNYWEYKIDGVLKISVGKNTKGNDYLRSHWAKKEDFWFHIENQPSAHLYLKLLSNRSLEPDLISCMGSILRDQGHLDILEIPIIYTQVKNLKGVKGSPGKVLFKKERHINVSYLPNWKEYLSSYCDK